jgi:ectoine hydrolase
MQVRGLAKGDVGLVGTDTVPWSTFQQLGARLPTVRWAGGDEILEELRKVKSAAEIEVLTRAAEIGSRAVDAMLDATRVGATYADVALAGLGVLLPVGAVLYNAFMSSGTGGDQPTMVRHHFPTYGVTAPLSRGQWFHVGLSGAYRGYYFDLARSVPVGDPTAEQVGAFEAAIACVQAVMAEIQPGVTAGELAAIGERRLHELGYPGGGPSGGLVTASALGGRRRGWCRVTPPLSSWAWCSRSSVRCAAGATSVTSRRLCWFQLTARGS